MLFSYESGLKESSARLRLQSTSNLVQGITRRKLQYFGHLKRHESTGRQIRDGRMPGKRRRGRQLRKWEDGISEHLGMSLATAGQYAQCRTAYRAAVYAATS